MSIKKLYNRFQAIINDPQRSFSERLFVYLSVVSIIAGIIALIGDIVIGESIYEIVVLIFTIILVPTITFTFLAKRKIILAIRIIIIGMIFIVLPSLFFFGGGVEGGGVLWVMFIFLYAGLVLTGKLRSFVLSLLTIMTLAGFLLEYFYPEIVIPHERAVSYVDTFLSLMLVSIVNFFMILFENRLFKEENERAQKEAKRAEELNRSQNRFFSSMSHEIRTPINTILGLNELILREEKIPEEVAKDAAGIQGAGKMLLSLINDILDFSKMEAGSMEIVPVDYKIGDIMSEVVNMIWVRAQEKGLILDVSVDPEVPNALYGDEVRIKQILINLLNNSVKYTNEGSVGLHIECEKVEESIVLLRISVSDTGIGIKKDTIPFIFDAFKRVDESKNKYIEGTGLGLSIVKHLVELMGGTITVNSVYGEGSTFNVVLLQRVSNPEPIGELSIHNYGKVKKHAYRSRFTAPDAKILIVDDNEMNLEVERKLLLSTKMQIDTAISGKKALEATLRVRYDTIFMDHLMPEMDGIECLNEIRNQIGGLNQSTPVIVLTANAGSKNKEMYINAGFDGYLVKPVSGEALEEILLNHIISEKINLRSSTKRLEGGTNTTSGYSRKLPVLITTSSMCDLPDIVMRDPRLPVLPFIIHTQNGSFKDVIQIGADELVRYIKTDKKAISSPPDVSEYTEFFAENIKAAHHIIYIALTTSMSKDYERAYDASSAFDNVTIINSECVSSAMGILVIIGCKLAQRGMSVMDIINELEMVKKKINCSFILGSTEFMLRSGRINPIFHRLAESLSLHPSIIFADDQYGFGSVNIGSRQYAYRKYIRSAFPVGNTPDSDVLFITYVDLDEETLLWIKKEVCKIAYFENIIFQQASAAISSNCGPGSFGLLYFTKSDKSYNVSSILPVETDDNSSEESQESLYEEDFYDANSINSSSMDKKDGSASKQSSWYENIEGIDGIAAIKNCGSEDTLKNVLKIFYDSIEDKSSELENYLKSGDIENFTIKVHALKSSSRLIGAIELSDMAKALEYAGKEGDMAYISENSDEFMNEYRKYKDLLSPLYSDSRENEDAETDSKAIADAGLIEDIYKKIKVAAEEMDCDAIDKALFILNDYIIPVDERDRINNIKNLASKYDYDGISEILNKM